MEYLSVLLPFLVFIWVFGGDTFLKQWMDNRKEIRLKELHVRALEAELKIKQKSIEETLPSWLDKNDPSEIKAYQRAQLEVLTNAVKK